MGLNLLVIYVVLSSCCITYLRVGLWLFTTAEFYLTKEQISKLRPSKLIIQYIGAETSLTITRTTVRLTKIYLHTTKHSDGTRTTKSIHYFSLIEIELPSRSSTCWWTRTWSIWVRYSNPGGQAPIPIGIGIHWFFDCCCCWE